MKITSKRALTSFSLILMYILGFLVFWFFNFQRVVVRGDSMMPTFTSGEVLWASKAYWLIGGIQRGDVIVIRDPVGSGYIIKRVHRLGGEIVDPLYAPLDFAFIKGEDEYKVPAGFYYVLGDNLEVSQDSRVFGPLPGTAVIGKYVRFTWASMAIATVPVLVLLLAAFWRTGERRQEPGAVETV